MDVKALLEDMLADGKTLLEQGKEYADQGTDYVADQLGVEADDPNRDMTKKATAGAAVVGALALGLGTETGRSLLKLGGLAALGALAYRAYQRRSDVAEAEADHPPLISDASGPDGERRAKALLAAIIAAARADGHVDANERALIERRVAELGEDARALFMDELMAPLDAGRIAALAQSAQEAREIYAISTTVCAEPGPRERGYLEDLAAALGLDRGMADDIDAAAHSI